jgi:PleD family two-component response regulator
VRAAGSPSIFAEASELADFHQSTDMSTGARILIIEDELPMRTVLSDALSGSGYRIIVASDGAVGWRKQRARSRI